MMIQVLAVSPDLKNDAVRVSQDWLRSLFRKSSMGLSLRQISKDIDDNKSTMWIAAIDNKPTGVAFTSIEKWREGKTLVINAIAGDDLEKWFPDFLETMRKYRKDENCHACYGIGRRGFTKYSDLGFKPTRYVYELTD